MQVHCLPVPSRFCLLARFALALFCFGAHATEHLDWPWLRPAVLAQGLRSLSHITHAGDGSERLFAVQLAGQIRVIDRTGQLLSQPFLDISSRIRPADGDEAGLWSVVFPPGFAQHRRYYVAYSRRSDGAFVVSRFTVSAFSSHQTDPASEQVILTHPHPAAYHYGGQLAFGPDGLLYVSCGDGHQSLQAQQLDSLYGKLLRIDPEGAAASGEPLPYRVPTTNPFVGTPNARPEIWALGLRNPWRFSFDRTTGELYISDVGELTREEINVQPASSRGGANYGWPYWEGSFDPRFATLPPGAGPFQAPALEYPRADGQSVIGGHVYRGPSQPRLNGLYVFSDFASGNVWGTKRVGSQWLRENIAARFPRITTWGEDESGRLLVATLNGQVHRLDDSDLPLPPRFEPKGYESADGDVDGSVATDRIRIIPRSPNSVVRYTFDLRAPTENDALVPPDGFVVVTNGTSLSARAWQDGRAPSEVQTSLFRLQTAPPRFSPPPGAITHDTLVSISCETADAIIHYTLDGSTPGVSAPIYSEPIQFGLEALRQGVTVRAVTIRSGFPNGRADGAFYLPRVASPRFAPAPGPINDGTTVVIRCDTPDATIRFETNGTLATLESPPYTGPFVVDGGLLVTAIAFRNDLRASDLAQALYTRAWETNFGFLGFSQFLTQASESHRSVDVTVVRSGSTHLPAWVEIVATGRGATPGLDYVATNGLLYFPPGSTSQTHSIPLLQDSLAEFSEDLSLVLQSATNAFFTSLNSSYVQITDDDVAGSIEFAASQYAVTESRPAARVLVKRTGGLAGNVGARLYTAPLIATDGEDFAGLDTHLVFQAGETQRAIDIPLKDDRVDEPVETLAIYLVNPTGGATLGARSSTVVNLRDDDPTSLIQFARKATRAHETNGTASVTIIRSGDSTGPASVYVYVYSRTATISADFMAADPLLIFAPGERTKEFTITLVDDDLAEGPESAEMLLSSVTGALLGPTRLATLDIEDDEVRLLGTYPIAGTLGSGSCATTFQGRLDITNQIGSRFDGRALLVGTTAGGYADLILTGAVNSAGNVFGNLHWRHSSGQVFTETFAGIARSGRLKLSFTNASEANPCRQRGQLTTIVESNPATGMAPSSFLGRTLIITPNRTHGSLAGRQPYRIEFASADRCTVISESAQFPPIASRWVHARSGPRTVTLWTGDEGHLNLRLNLSFTSSTNGGFSGRAAAGPGSHSGIFRLDH